MENVQIEPAEENFPSTSGSAEVETVVATKPMLWWLFAAISLIFVVATVFEVFTGLNAPFAGEWEQRSSQGLYPLEASPGTIITLSLFGEVRIKGGTSDQKASFSVLSNGKLKVVTLESGREASHLYDYQLSLAELTLKGEGGVEYKYARKNS